MTLTLRVHRWSAAGPGNKGALYTIKPKPVLAGFLTKNIQEQAKYGNYVSCVSMDFGLLQAQGCPQKYVLACSRKVEVQDGLKWQELFILLLQLTGKCIRQRGLNSLCEVGGQMGQEGQSLLTVFSGLWKNHFVPLPQVLIKQWLIHPYRFTVER